MKNEMINPITRISVKHSIIYGTMTWIISLIVSPILFSIALWLGGEDVFHIDKDYMGWTDFMGQIYLFVLFGGLFSIPNWIIFTIFISILGQLNLTMPMRRFYIQLIAMVMTFALFYIMGFARGAENLLMIGVYCAGLSVGIWLLPVPSEIYDV